MENKLSSLFLFYVVLTIACFGQNDLNALEKAYENKSLEQLNQFLSNWKAESKTISVKSLNGLEKDAYSIFQDFYDPFNLKKLDARGSRPNMYSTIEYIIVQNSIDIWMVESETLPDYLMEGEKPPKRKKIHIDNFRPQLNLGKPVLFLFPKYKIIINDFLKTKDYDPRTGGVMRPSDPEIVERSWFLNAKLKVIYGHWGGYWHLETHPEVSNINFNKNKNIAKVYFRVRYETGFALYKKQKSEWNLQYTRITGIE